MSRYCHYNSNMRKKNGANISYLFRFVLFCMRSFQCTVRREKLRLDVGRLGEQQSSVTDLVVGLFNYENIFFL